MVADMATRYDGHLVKTRTAAAGVAILSFGFLLPFLAMRIDLSRPARTVTLATLTLLPLLSAFRCLRFLSQQERQHTTPTPEMTFIFGLAVSLPLVFAGVVLIMLSTYN